MNLLSVSADKENICQHFIIMLSETSSFWAKLHYIAGSMWRALAQIINKFKELGCWWIIVFYVVHQSYRCKRKIGEKGALIMINIALCYFYGEGVNNFTHFTNSLQICSAFILLNHLSWILVQWKLDGISNLLTDVDL